MAEIFRADGCVVKVFSNDHSPAHVHVSSAEHKVKIDISGTEAIVLKAGKRERKEEDPRFAKRALRLVNSRFAEVKAAWEAIQHGK